MILEAKVKVRTSGNQESYKTISHKEYGSHSSALIIEIDNNESIYIDYEDLKKYIDILKIYLDKTP